MGKDKNFPPVSTYSPNWYLNLFYVILKIPSDENPYHYEIRSVIYQQRSITQTLTACHAFGNYTM